MGSISFLTVADYPIMDFNKGYYKKIVNRIFRPTDFVEEKRSSSSRNSIIWGDSYKDDKRKYTFRGFRQSAIICKKRLEIYGYTLSRTKKDFNATKNLIVREGLYDFPVKTISFDDYIAEIRSIIIGGVRKYDNELDYYSNFHDHLMHEELIIEGMEFEYGLYSILTALNDTDVVEYDFTDLFDGSWADKSEVKDITIEKIIILTEGRSDAEFINKSMLLLEPHLHPYYHFIDFEGYKVEGSASALVKLVKAFAASNVKHPIIAIFDNDTAGIAELAKLKQQAFPENIKIIKLPDIKIARNYPTVGPTGKRNMNVNGLACGIEMYLGADVLLDGQSYIPIRWRDFNESVGQYQGSLIDKEAVQKRFRAKVKSGVATNMVEMDLLLQTVFSAFN